MIDLLALLKRLEWNHGGVEFCPECLGAKQNGHILKHCALDCDLAVAIAELEARKQINPNEAGQLAQRLRALMLDGDCGLLEIGDDFVVTLRHPSDPLD